MVLMMHLCTMSKYSLRSSLSSCMRVFPALPAREPKLVPVECELWVRLMWRDCLLALRRLQPRALLPRRLDGSAASDNSPPIVSLLRLAGACVKPRADSQPRADDERGLHSSFAAASEPVRSNLNLAQTEPGRSGLPSNPCTRTSRCNRASCVR